MMKYLNLFYKNNSIFSKIIKNNQKTDFSYNKKSLNKKVIKDFFSTNKFIYFGFEFFC